VLATGTLCRMDSHYRQQKTWSAAGSRRIAMRGRPQNAMQAGGAVIATSIGAWWLVFLRAGHRPRRPAFTNEYAITIWRPRITLPTQRPSTFTPVRIAGCVGHGWEGNPIAEGGCCKPPPTLGLDRLRATVPARAALRTQPFAPRRLRAARITRRRWFSRAGTDASCQPALSPRDGQPGSRRRWCSRWLSTAHERGGGRRSRRGVPKTLGAVSATSTPASFATRTQTRHLLPAPSTSCSTRRTWQRQRNQQRKASPTAEEAGWPCRQQIPDGATRAAV